MSTHEAVKAHYRVGLAYLARDEFELAKAWFEGLLLVGGRVPFYRGFWVAIVSKSWPSWLRNLRCKDALTSAHEIEPSNADIVAALKQLKKNMEDYKTRRRNLTQRG